MIGSSSGLHRTDAMRRTFSNRDQFSTTATVFPVDLAALRRAGGEMLSNFIRISLRYEPGAKRDCNSTFCCGRSRDSSESFPGRGAEMKASRRETEAIKIDKETHRIDNSRERGTSLVTIFLLTIAMVGVGGVRTRLVALTPEHSQNMEAHKWQKRRSDAACPFEWSDDRSKSHQLVSRSREMVR